MINLRWIYQAPIAVVKWIANLVKTIVLFVYNLVKNLISTIYTWIETKLKMINARFWIGIALILTGGYFSSLQPRLFLELVLNNRLTMGESLNDIVLGLFIVLAGLICVIFSADYSKFRLWGNKQ